MEIIEDRHGKRSTLVASQLPQEKWYELFDDSTIADAVLDRLTHNAHRIARDTPISSITFIDDSRQWFKARKGFDIQEAPRKDSFCQHALHHPKEILVINDPLNDKRFQNNPFVYGQPYIRFYTGAPLETPQGNVLGTLCVIDNKPRNISDNQKKALQLLAKKAMGYLEDRKLIIEQADKIESTASRLKKITDQVPGAIYQFESSSDGKISFQFISKGISDIHPCLKSEELKEKPDKILKFIHPDDLALVQKSFQESISNLTEWNIEFWIVSDDGSIIWVLTNAKLERKDDETIVWYGILRDTTERKEYIKTLEQILFDISHTMRRPVATMLGLIAGIESYNMNEKTLKEYIGHIKTVSEEMDKYIKILNEAYYGIKLKVTSHQPKQ